MPLGHHIDPLFFMAWNRLEKYGADVIEVEGVDLVTAQNGAVREALRRSNWERAVFIETDHVFPPNALERVSYYETPITGALYHLADELFRPCCVVPQAEQIHSERVWREWGRGDARWLPPQRLVEWRQRNQLFRVLGVGMGFTAIDREVFEGWPKGLLWFDTPRELDETGKERAWTSDLYFCREAAKQGWQVHLDPVLAIQHIKPQFIDTEHHLRALGARAVAMGLKTEEEVEAQTGQLLQQIR